MNFRPFMNEDARGCQTLPDSTSVQFFCLPWSPAMKSWLLRRARPPKIVFAVMRNRSDIDSVASRRSTSLAAQALTKLVRQESRQHVFLAPSATLWFVSLGGNGSVEWRSWAPCGAVGAIGLSDAANNIGAHRRACQRQPRATCAMTLRDSFAPSLAPFSKSPSIRPIWLVTFARQRTGFCRAAAKA